MATRLGATTKGRLIVFLAVVWFGQSVCADIIFTAPPRENQQKAEEIYGPIAEQLSEILGEHVVYKKPTGWFDYSNRMRAGEYDIVFDGPHFAAWRVKHLKHIPVASLPGRLRFVVIVNKGDEGIKSVRDLAGVKVCSMLSPFLGTNLIYDMIDNPVLQPIIHEVGGGMKGVYQAFKRGECRAALLRDVMFNKLPKDQRSATRVLQATTALPNQTITVSQRLQKNAQQIADFMLSQEGVIAADGLLKQYSGKEKHFEPATAAQYDGVERLLEGVVWGW
jgi:ABC-type phosphate/phosphonate transport system substrate-binding protein